MHKRRAFAHEREVRVVLWPPAGGFVKLEPILEEMPPPPVNPKPQFGLDWDIEAAIENIFVSPYANEQYRDVVAAVLEKFAPSLAARLRWSDMKGTPSF